MHAAGGLPDTVFQAARAAQADRHDLALSGYIKMHLSASDASWLARQAGLVADQFADPEAWAGREPWCLVRDTLVDAATAIICKDKLDKAEYAVFTGEFCDAGLAIP